MTITEEWHGSHSKIFNLQSDFKFFYIFNFHEVYAKDDEEWITGRVHKSDPH